MRAKTIILSAITITAILAVLLPFTPQASAGDTACSGTLPVAGSPYDNVVVNSGDSCTVGGGITINGNFQANGAVDVTISGFPSPTTIGGDVQITESTGNTLIQLVSVGGSIQIEKNQSPTGTISVNRNTVGNNIEVNDNEAREIRISSNNFNSGDIIVLKNTVDITQDRARSIIDVSSNSPQNIIIQENTVKATGTSSASVGITASRNTVTGNIQLVKNTGIADGVRFSNIVQIGVFSNSFSSGNIQILDNTASATSSNRRSDTQALIQVSGNGFGGSPQNIEAIGNSATADGETGSGSFSKMKALVAVDRNDVIENIKVQKNTASADGIHTQTIITATISASDNSFSPGNLQVQENTATATGPGADRAEIDVSGNNNPQNIEVQKNTASTPGSELVTVDSNTADENIQCSENSPTPIGADNVGNLEGQCSGLS